MTPRSIRRAQERKAQKQARKEAIRNGAKGDAAALEPEVSTEFDLHQDDLELIAAAAPAKPISRCNSPPTAKTRN